MSKLRKVTGFIILPLFCAILIYILLIVVFPPRVFLSPYYVLSVFIATGVSFFAFSFVSSRLIPKIERSGFIQSIQRWTKRKRIISFVLIMIIFVLLVLLKPGLDNFNDKKVLEEAKQQITPITYGVISQAKVDRTLVELQKTLDELRGKYIEKAPDYLIRVHLFSDRNELIQKTGMSEWTAGGTLMLSGRPPEVIIPVEKEASIWDNTLPTSTPSHEATHVVTFEAMNLKDSNIVPRFYLEGMAEYESLKEFSRCFDGIWYRIRLIFYKNQLTRLESIPTLNIRDKSVKNEDIVLFYRLSNEFIKYLADNYGADKSWCVVLDVGQGMSFYEAFKKEYNKEYSATYSEFLAYFY